MENPSNTSLPPSNESASVDIPKSSAHPSLSSDTAPKNEVSASSQRVSVPNTNKTIDYEINNESKNTPLKKTSTPSIHPPPPPQAFSSLPLLPGAVLSSSQSPVGTTSSSRIYEQSKNLGYVQNIETHEQSVLQENDNATLRPSSKMNSETTGVGFDKSSDSGKGHSAQHLTPNLGYLDVQDTDTVPVKVSKDTNQSSENKESDVMRQDIKKVNGIDKEDSIKPKDSVSLLNKPKTSLAKEVDQTDRNQIPSRTSTKQETEVVRDTPLEAEDSCDAISISSIPATKSSIVVSSDLSNPNSDSSTAKNNKHIEGGVITTSGASSPSILSYQGGSTAVRKDSQEAERREEIRLNHLSLLLELHRKNENRKEAKNKQVADASVVDKEKTNKKGNRHTLSFDRKEDDSGYKTDSTRTRTSTSTSTSTRLASISNVSESINRGLNPTPLFENFEKNWTSLYSSSLNRERICFASAVVVLLNDHGWFRCPSAQSLKQVSVGSGKVSQGEIYFSSRMYVPLSVFRLFWKETVLPSIGLPSGGADVFIENLIEMLFDKLRYLVQVNNHSKEVKTSVHLSHEVYGEYAKYIMHFDDDMQQQLDEWRSSFTKILENIFLSGINENISIETRRYAAVFLPLQILSLCDPLGTTSSTPMLTQDRHDEYTLKFIKLMTNSHFLSWRIAVFGDGVEIDGSTSEDYSGKRKKTDETSRNRWNILRATSHHVKDLERFISVHAASGDKVVTSDLTSAILSMYQTWKTECVEVLNIAKKHLNVDDELAFGRKNDHKGKNLSPLSTNGRAVTDKNEVASSNPSYVDPGSSAVVDSSKKASSTFLEKNSLIQRNVPMKRHKKSKDLAYVRYMSSSTDGLPTQYHPLPGEYTIDPKMTLISLKKVTLVRDPQNGIRPLPRVRVLHNSARMISKSPVMRLSDIIAIDLRALHLQMTLGKVMNLLSQSISEASCTINQAANQANNSDSHNAYGPLLAKTKVQYTAESIEIYSRTMNVMSFLLSEDLVKVDEKDLTDLGYHDNGRGSLSMRLKKLKNDRIEANTLIGHLSILCAESWYEMGKILCDGAKSCRATAMELAKISILNLPSDSLYANNGQHQVLRKGECDEPEKLQNKVLHCHQFSLSLLKQNSNTGDKPVNGGLSSRPRSSDIALDLEWIEFYKSTLLASIIHSIGVHYYAQVGNLETAKLCLYEALSRRRLLLRHLQKDANDLGSTSGPNIDCSHRRRRRSAKQYNGLRENLSQNGEIFASGLSKKEQIDRMELDLSYTLEFAALTSHSHLDHQTSISFFQEAIILRALHAGKNSLDVARLHYNMGVIHDDLGQHEASLSRYGKSLRVRLSHLDRFNAPNNDSNPTEIQKTSGPFGIDDLEVTIVLTLRCMGNVYRALKDTTNALNCYMKAIELLKNKLRRLATDSNFGIYQDSYDCELGFGRGTGNKLVDLPIPGSNADELQQRDNYITPISVLGLVKNENVAETRPFENKATTISEDDKIRKDIANMYSTIVSLVNDRKQQDETSAVGSARSGYLSASGYSSGGYRSVSSTRTHRSGKSSTKSRNTDKNKLDGNSDDDEILLHAAFNLGMVTMHFGEYQNAMCYFEEAFRTIWTSIGNNEGSDSDFSSKGSSSTSSRRRSTSSESMSIKSGNQCQVEEGIVYHAMAMAHAALSEHERAIRCFLTALRYYRRRLGMGSLKEAGALYDCGSSYWHLGDYSKAEEFWADCFRIIYRDGKNFLKKTGTLSEDNAKLNKVQNKNLDTNSVREQPKVVGDAEYARILHNLGNVHLQNGHLDVASQCYEEALAIRRTILNISTYDHTVLTQLCESSANSTAIHEKLRDLANTLHNLGWLYEMQSMYEKALSCLNQALFIKQNLSSKPEIRRNHNEEQNSLAIVLSRDEMNLGKTLSCAITLLRIGSIHAKIYNHDIALSYYRAALSIQRSELGNNHIAVARTLFDMGQIANHHTDASGLNKDAMTCFNEALRIAKLQFGQHHYAVAGVMYDIGSIHDKSGNDLDAISYYRSSVKVYGRIYAQSLLKRFCFIPIFRTVGSVSNINYEGFNPAGLGDEYSIENRARSTVQQALAVEECRDRDLFVRALIALTAVAERSGVISHYTFLGFELWLMKFVEGLASDGIESIRGRVRRFILAFVNHFEQVEMKEEPRSTFQVALHQ